MCPPILHWRVFSISPALIRMSFTGHVSFAVAEGNRIAFSKGKLRPADEATVYTQAFFTELESSQPLSSPDLGGWEAKAGFR